MARTATKAPPPVQSAAPDVVHTSGLGLIQGELETLENLADRVTSAETSLEKIVLKAEYDTHLARIRRIVVAAEESERAVLDTSLRRRALGIGVEAMVGSSSIETPTEAPVATPVVRDLGSLFNQGTAVESTGTVIDVQV